MWGYLQKDIFDKVVKLNQELSKMTTNKRTYYMYELKKAM